MSTIAYLGGIHQVVSDDDRDVYQGYADDQPLNLAVGEEAEVSAEKAEQLAEDFPGCFEVEGKVAGDRPSAPAPDAGDGDDLRAQLLKHKRPELDAAARELGIDAPEALPNKPAVVDAILERRQES